MNSVDMLFFDLVRYREDIFLNNKWAPDMPKTAIDFARTDANNLSTKSADQFPTKTRAYRIPVEILGEPGKTCVFDICLRFCWAFVW